MRESFLDGKVILHPGDCLDVLKTLAPNSVDSIVTDPPYHLTTNKKGGTGTASVNLESPYGRSRIGTGNGAGGFMGKAWDGGDIAFRVELWAEVLRVLKPGGHVAAFGGTRTIHRMTCAIEDAGFEIRDQLQWLYGSGFPKSLDVSKVIDKAARGVPQGGSDPTSVNHGKFKGGCSDDNKRGQGFGAGPGQFMRDAGQSSERELVDEAKPWDGFGTALKPACEPICLARKPLIGTVAENVLTHGTGALNIDGCRIAYEAGGTIASNPAMRVAKGHALRSRSGGFNGGDLEDRSDGVSQQGRWPANVIHDGSDEVVGAFPETTSGTYAASHADGGKDTGILGAMNGRQRDRDFIGSTGSAARFFYTAKQDSLCQLCNARIWSCDVSGAESSSRTVNTPTGGSVHLDVADSPQPENGASAHPHLGRASSAENSSQQCRPPKVDIVPSDASTGRLSKIVQNVSDAASLCSLCVTSIARALAEVGQTGTPVRVHFNPSIGSFRETILSRCLASYVASRENTDTILTTTNLRELFGCVFHAIAESINSEKAGSAENTRPEPKRLFYSSKADADDRLGSKHPTVKPLDLMQWLVRLVTPPGGLVLDPFAGTGTTGEAAFREGFRAILIEREPEYQNDIRRRMAHAMAGPDERKRTIAKIKNPNPVNDGLFALLEQPSNLSNDSLPNTTIKVGLS